MTKMKNFNLAFATLIAAAFISGCSLSKMIKLASQQDLQVNPNPVELHAGEVPYNISAVLPPKMLPKGMVYTLKNFYQYGDQEIEVGEIEFKAADFPNSSSSTSRKAADFKFNYTDKLNPGKLVVQGTALDPRSGKSMVTAKMDVALGVITTSSAVKDAYATAYADHGYNDKEELIPTNVNFYFAQGQSTLTSSIATDGESNKAKQNTLSAFIANKNVTRTVTITGTHSPEGNERINSGLSGDRAKRIESYYRAQMKKYDYKGTADSIKFILKPVVEDWKDFRKALLDYEMDDAKKQAFIRVLNGTGSFEDKEKAIQKLDGYKGVFDKIYPTLRTAKTEILTVKQKKSAVEIALLAKQIVGGSVKNDTLSSAELLYAATLTPSLSEKEGIYKAATKKDGSWVAHNNLAATYIEMARQGEEKYIQDAITQLDIAANKSKSPEIQANMATAFIMQGNYDQAYEALTNAEGSASNDLKADISAAKGSIEIRQANYDQAKATLVNASNNDATKFNRGLVSILTKDFNGAGDYFDTVTDSPIGADAYYYKAVAAARAKNASEVVSNLKEAVGKDSSLKDKALNDLEFSNFADAVAQALR
jgi:hypothetical protein